MWQFPSCINIWGGQEQEGQSGFLNVDTHLASILSLGNQSSGSKRTRKIRRAKTTYLKTHLNLQLLAFRGGKSTFTMAFQPTGKYQCNQGKGGRTNNAWLLPLLFNDIKIHIRYVICVFVYNILELETTDFNL